MADSSTPLANRARFSLGEIAAATGGELAQLPVGVDLQTEVVGVSTDTRTIGEGSLFVALHGARFNGHAFLQEATARGARAAVVEQSSLEKLDAPPEKLALIVVKSTLRALGVIAKFHRARFDIPVVAVTGSYGKTTTRAMIVAALGAKYRVLTSQENFNNEIGVPHTLLQLDETHEAAVVELAMRGAGQIAYLAEIAAPTVGVITNIGPQHIELLGSIENIAAAKAEILAFLPATGAAILPADDEYLDFFTDQANAARIVTFGSNPSAEYCASNIRTASNGNVAFSLHNAQFTLRHLQLPLPGAHNAINAAAALAVAGVLGVPLDAAAHALERVEVPGARMRVLRNEARDLTIIDDCYNAGPTSMRAALETLRDFPDAKRRVAVLGAMRELGQHSETEHRGVGALAANCAELVLGVGEETRVLLEEAREVGTIPFYEEWCEGAAEAAGKVLDLVREGDVVLVKGSRSVGLEAVVNALVGESE
jgi:UDP-N-acetylmuramoyl-tripeptide--D-alanyl-D-alanine ligase